MIRSFNIADDADWATYTGVSTSNSNRSYLLNLRTMESTLISDPYAERLSSLNLGEVKDWDFTSTYGDRIEGRYYLPPNFDSTKKYPLIVYYYGEPVPLPHVRKHLPPARVRRARLRGLHPSAQWNHRVRSRILCPPRQCMGRSNRRGDYPRGRSIRCSPPVCGWHQDRQYRSLIRRVYDAIPHHEERPILGFGLARGYQQHRQLLGRGLLGLLLQCRCQCRQLPLDNPELYVKQSPLFHADKINTPLLLLHGTADTNVPIGESIQMYTALKLLGKEVEFIQVEGENHAIYNYDKRIAWNNAIYAWFAKWLKEDPRWWDSMYPDK